VVHFSFSLVSRNSRQVRTFISWILKSLYINCLRSEDCHQTSKHTHAPRIKRLQHSICRCLPSAMGESYLKAWYRYLESFMHIYRALFRNQGNIRFMPVIGSWLTCLWKRHGLSDLILHGRNPMGMNLTTRNRLLCSVMSINQLGPKWMSLDRWNYLLEEGKGWRLHLPS